MTTSVRLEDNPTILSGLLAVSLTCRQLYRGIGSRPRHITWQTS